MIEDLDIKVPSNYRKVSKPEPFARVSRWDRMEKRYRKGKYHSGKGPTLRSKRK